MPVIVIDKSVGRLSRVWQHSLLSVSVVYELCCGCSIHKPVSRRWKSFGMWDESHLPSAKTSLTLLTGTYNLDRSQPSYISSAGFLCTFKKLLSRFYSLDFHFSRPTLRRMDGRHGPARQTCWSPIIAVTAGCGIDNGSDDNNQSLVAIIGLRCPFTFEVHRECSYSSQEYCKYVLIQLQKQCWITYK